VTKAAGCISEEVRHAITATPACCARTGTCATAVIEQRTINDLVLARINPRSTCHKINEAMPETGSHQNIQSSCAVGSCSKKPLEYNLCWGTACSVAQKRCNMHYPRHQSSVGTLACSACSA
jgi:hypothetical protein